MGLVKWFIKVVGSFALYKILFSDSWNLQDAEWMARLIVGEAGDIDPSDEWTAIGYVAKNRSARQKVPIKVVARNGWNNSQEFQEALNDGGRFQNHPRYVKAFVHAMKIMTGQVKNPIGKRVSFSHPNRFRSCSQPGAVSDDGKFICVHYSWLDGPKDRWTPRWLVYKSDHPKGAAQNRVVRVGRAIFA